MKYYVHKPSGELKQGWSALKDWVYLPDEFQDKMFEDIRAAKLGEKVIITHHDLKPQMLFSNHWSVIEAVRKGTQVTVTNGIVGFKEPMPSPTEQRDNFQKNFPHLVNFIPRRKGFKVVAQADTSPKHYRQGKIEPWDFITSQGMSFLEGNIVKYVTRYKTKGGLGDLLKAKTYLEKLIFEVSKCEDSKN